MILIILLWLEVNSPVPPLKVLKELSLLTPLTKIKTFSTSLFLFGTFCIISMLYPHYFRNLEIGFPAFGMALFYFSNAEINIKVAEIAEIAEMCGNLTYLKRNRCKNIH